MSTNTIDQIDQEITEITALPALVDDDFYAAGNNLYGVEMPNMSKEFQSFIPKLNKTIDGINTASQTIEETSTTVSFQKEEIDVKHNEVMNRIIPKEATYTTEEINSLIVAQQEAVDTVYAKKEGHESQQFNVGKATENNHAVNKVQMETAIQNKLPFPIGHKYSEIKSEPAENELLQVGGLFNRADEPLLWKNIEEQQTALLLTDEEWQIENTANGGVCGYFSSGDGSTTFRLMNLSNAFFRAVDNSSRLAGSFQEDINKAHSHGHIGFGQLLTRGVGGDGNFWEALGSHTTGTEGGSEARPKNIGVLPLIVARELT